jgi:hypothetical protein
MEEAVRPRALAFSRVPLENQWKQPAWLANDWNSWKAEVYDNDDNAKARLSAR